MEKPRDSWVWLLVLFSFGGLVETIFYGQLMAFTPLYLPQIGIRPEDVTHWTGMIAAITGLIGLPFLPFWGALSDRFARKPVIIRSFIVELITASLAILAGNIWIFILARAISSLSLGNSGLMMTTLSERAPASRQALAFSIVTGAGPIGAFLGPLAGGPIIDHFGFRALMAIDAVLLLAVILSLTFGYRDYFKPSHSGPLVVMAWDSVKAITGTDRLRALFLAMFLLFSGWMMANTYAPLVVAKLYTGPDLGTRVGAVIGAGGFVALILAPLLGSLADRYGVWRMLFIGAGIEAAIWSLPILTSNLLVFGAIWAVINGISTSVFSISFTVLAQSSPSEIRGRVMSMAYLPLNIGLFLGPAIGSQVTRGSVFNIFPTAAVLTILSFPFLILAYRTTHPKA